MALVCLAAAIGACPWTLASESEPAALPIGSIRPGDAARACDNPAAPGRRIVAAAIDAETLRLEDGSEVRLVGALAPRSPTSDGATASWPVETAARDALAALTVGRAVTLAYAGQSHDRYGRHLAQVFVEPANGGTSIWVQKAMIEAGHARAYGLPGSFGCVEALVTAESAARESRAGIWALAAFRPRDARRSGELAAVRDTYQLVEGRIMRARRSGASIYLDFGRDWRRDFSAAVHAATAAENPAWAASLLDLKGRRTRVRGWIARRNGPMIVIEHPSQIELLRD